MDADTKLVPCVLLVSRNAASAEEFISDLASRLRHRVQLTSDGFRPYLQTVENAFGTEVDYAMLVKIHSTLQVTPAMAAGVTTRVFDVADLVAMLVESESKKAA